MITVKETSKLINAGLQSQLAIPEFIDAFNASDTDTRKKMVAEPPESIMSENITAYLAAVVEHLCHKNGMTPPVWVQGREYFLRRPCFYGGERLKAVLISESPVAFRRRNIFVSANATDRC